jgi:hypothetical protein
MNALYTTNFEGSYHIVIYFLYFIVCLLTHELLSHFLILNFIEHHIETQTWWQKPVIPDIREAEAGGSPVRKTLSQEQNARKQKDCGPGSSGRPWFNSQCHNE